MKQPRLLIEERLLAAIGLGRIRERQATQAMLRVLRIFVGLLLTGLLLYAANLAVRDCASGVQTYDNCLWLWLRGKLGLSQSKLLRAGALEFVGLALLAGLYLAIRYVFPRSSGKQPPRS